MVPDLAQHVGPVGTDSRTGSGNVWLAARVAVIAMLKRRFLFMFFFLCSAMRAL